QQGEPVLLVGSSLGGYYSLYLAERFANCRAVLINPAVYPYRLLHDLLGENQNMYTGQRYQLTALHIAQLKALDVERPSDPERLLLLTQTGDETLDYREAVSKLDAITQCVTQGGDHSYQGFEQKIEQIISFGLGSR
ncbi:MAG: YqiA/YcfP family alpha/beta fold hydrolase, partial [Pseudomonadales bacterium]